MFKKKFAILITTRSILPEILIQIFCICYAMVGVPLFFYIMKRTSDFLLKKIKPLVYVVGGFISCSLLPAVVFHYIEGWTLLQAWYFTMQTLFTIGFGDYCPTCKLLQ